MTPILVDDPILALGMTVDFPPWERFFDFPFRSYSCFRKKIRLTRQKVFPPPTVEIPSASKSPSALRAGLINKTTMDARWDFEFLNKDFEYWEILFNCRIF